jgi:DNA-directed RNA polymerase specialized sigma24 family protein
VIDSFARVFAQSKATTDEEFPIALFSVAREICHQKGLRGSDAEGDLSSREREVVALVFDAQFNRAQIASLLRLKDADVASVLLRGLRKLRATMTLAQPPAFFRSA